MKFAVVLLFLMPFLGRAQDSYPKIDGIGEFKIGKTPVTVINDLAVKWGTKIKSSNDYKTYELSRASPSILLMQQDTVQLLRNQEGILCPQVQVIYLNFYPVADMRIEDVYLTFYNGILAEFKSNTGKDLFDALKLKYGPGISKQETTAIKCVYKLTGNEAEDKDEFFSDVWSNGQIRATYLISKIHDSDCKPIYGGLFSVQNTATMNLVKSCHAKVLANIKQKQDESKKRKLSDF